MYAYEYLNTTLEDTKCMIVWKPYIKEVLVKLYTQNLSHVLQSHAKYNDSK